MNADLLAKALPALLAGTTRKPVSLALTELQALSLTGQALRFSRPAAGGFSVEEPVEDLRTPIPEALRKPLCRLLAGRKGTVAEHDSVSLMIALTLENRKLRLHPFDLPRLEPFVAAYAVRLGNLAQAWVQRAASPEQKAGYFDAELTDETWSQAGFPAKARYIETRRKTDAAAALSLVQAVWAQENADGRVRLLKTLRAGLGEADTVFLESLEKDRAPRVRELAQKLLSRLGQGTPALKACLERIEKTQTGLLKKRPVLSLRPPATVQEFAVPAWILETFADLSPEDLAAALELSAADLIEASQKDSGLLFALLVMATGEGRLDLVEQVMDQGLSQAWEVFQLLPPLDLSAWEPADRVRWAELVVQPSTWGTASLASMLALLKMIEVPLSDRLMDALLSSKVWLTMIKDEQKVSAELLDTMAAACPASRRRALKVQLDKFTPAVNGRALAALEILSALEALA